MLKPALSCALLAAALLISAPESSGQNHFINFTTLGTFTTPTLNNGHLALSADDGAAPALVNVLNLNGLGVVGGDWDNMTDSDEALHFDFDTPVTEVIYTVFVANNQDGDGLLGESFLEAFDGATSLGVVAVNDTGFHQVSNIFGGVPITSFTVRADGEGNRIDTLRYTVNPWADAGPGLAGTNGVPVLEGAGSLAPGSAYSVTTTGLLENHVAAVVLGLSAVNAPFKGGVFVPNPDALFLGLPTGPTGVLSLDDHFPNGVPSGFTFYVQTWLTDPAGIKGHAASNAVSGTTP
jgi:hypothetical protein